MVFLYITWYRVVELWNGKTFTQLETFVITTPNLCYALLFLTTIGHTQTFPPQSSVGLFSYQKLLDDYISSTLLALVALQVVHLFIVMYPHQYLHGVPDITGYFCFILVEHINRLQWCEIQAILYSFPGVKSKEGNQWRVKQIEYEC